MDQITYVAIALAILAALLLAGAGIKLVRRRESRVRGVLMIVAALVLIMNVMIATV